MGRNVLNELNLNAVQALRRGIQTSLGGQGRLVGGDGPEANLNE